MLTKALCKKCYDEHRVRPWDKFFRIDKLTQERYNQKDRTWDERGKMACVAGLDQNHKTIWVKVNGKPPACCYYLVEQLMLGTKNENRTTQCSD